jgi:hypothetical protein
MSTLLQPLLVPLTAQRHQQSATAAQTVPPLTQHMQPPLFLQSQHTQHAVRSTLKQKLHTSAACEYRQSMIRQCSRGMIYTAVASISSLAQSPTSRIKNVNVPTACTTASAVRSSGSNRASIDQTHATAPYSKSKHTQHFTRLTLKRKLQARITVGEYH